MDTSTRQAEGLDSKDRKDSGRVRVVDRQDSKSSQELMDSMSPDALARFQLNNAITLIGPGPYQLVVLCLAGGVYMAEGSLLLMLSVIAKSLIERWKLSVLLLEPWLASSSAAF